MHAGGGLELSLLVASERDEEGLALRFSPVLLSDAVTCFDFEEPPCQGALFALFELGPRYRWKLRGLAVSLGISLNAGLLFLRTRQGVPQTTAVFGVMGPKLQIEF